MNETLAAANRIMHGAYEATVAGRRQREIDVQLVAGDYILLAERAVERLAAALAAAEAERDALRTALQDAQGIALNGPPGGAKNRLDAIDERITAALAASGSDGGRANLSAEEDATISDALDALLIAVDELLPYVHKLGEQNAGHGLGRMAARAAKQALTDCAKGRAALALLRASSAGSPGKEGA